MRAGLVRKASRFCILLAAWLFAGCGAPPDSTQQKLVYQDRRLQLGVVAGSPLEQAIDDLCREWHQQTGAVVEIVRHTADELNDDPAGAYRQDDVLLYPSWAMGELAAAKLLVPLPESLLKDPAFAWDAVLPAVQSSCMWGDDVVAAPMGAPSLLCYYRRDLLEQLGLSAPQTWKDYFRTADRLRELARSEDDAPYAVAEPLGIEGRRAVFLARAAAYGKHPDNFSFLFNKRTMQPLIAEEGFVRALEDLIAARDRGPIGQEASERIEKWIQAADRNPYGDPPETTYAGGTPLFDEGTGQTIGRDEYVLRRNPQLHPVLHYTVDDVHRALREGRAGLGLAWERTTVGAEPDESISIGVERLPGATQVFQMTRGEWDAAEQGANRPTVLGLSGLCLSVGENSADPQAAFDLVRFVCSNETRTPLLSQERDLVPYRQTHFSDPTAWVGRGTSASQASQYSAAVRATFEAENVVTALRIPGSRRYLEALDAALEAALTGRAPPREALEEAARKWQQITEELGLDAQRGYYEKCLGLATL